MSSLIVEVCEVDGVTKHPNADNLDLVVVKGWQTISGKGTYNAGDKVVFIPPDAVLPDELIEKYGVRQYLSNGKVKQIRLRGEMSFGLIINPEQDWEVGRDVKDELGITKYEPPVSNQHKQGAPRPSDQTFPKYTDIENIRHFNKILSGQQVIVTEKIDGSNVRLAYINGEFRAGSRNLEREDDGNVYWVHMDERVFKLLKELGNFFDSIILYGELYGAVTGGLKQMNYDKPGEICFAAFDIMCDGKYLDFGEVLDYCIWAGIPTVPVLGYYDFDSLNLDSVSSGKSLIASHIREGVVIRPVHEQSHPKLGRVILKSLNNDYLLLKKKDIKDE